MKKMTRLIALFLLTAVSACAVYLFFFAGDLFLRYLGEQLGINIAYKNHLGFVSCFINKSMLLSAPRFTPKESGAISINCSEARIVPDFRTLFRRGSINLVCEMANPLITKDGKKINIYLPEAAGLSEFTDFLNNADIVKYDTLHLSFELFEDKIEVTDFNLKGKDIMAVFSGNLSKDNSLDILLKVYLSQTVVSKMPEPLKEMLTSEGGWGLFSLKLESIPKRRFLRVEGDRFRFTFGEPK